MAKVQFIKFDMIKGFASRAAKERVSVKDTASTVWFGIFENFYTEESELVGFGGVIIKGSKARVKSIYVLPEHRGKGYGSLLTEHMIRAAQKIPHIKTLEAYAVNPKYYEALGWVSLQTAKGITVVQRRLLGA